MSLPPFSDCQAYFLHSRLVATAKLLGFEPPEGRESVTIWQEMVTISKIEINAIMRVCFSFFSYFME